MFNKGFNLKKIDTIRGTTNVINDPNKKKIYV